MWENTFEKPAFLELGTAHLALIFLVVSGRCLCGSRTSPRIPRCGIWTIALSFSACWLSTAVRTANREVLNHWSGWMGRSGARVTLIGVDGTVLADSEENPAKMDNHAGRPEIRDALEHGSGRAVRYSATLGHDLLYLAILRATGDGTPLIIRMSLPLRRLNEAVAHFRNGLWMASAIILVGAAAVSLLYFRSLSNRIERLRQFSSRVAAGISGCCPWTAKRTNCPRFPRR